MDQRQFQDAIDAWIPLTGSGNAISDALDVVSDNGKSLFNFYLIMIYNLYDT